jgi:hypothetical protein
MILFSLGLSAGMSHTSFLALLYALGVVGSVLIFLAAFAPGLQRVSSWIRAAFFLFVPVCLGWSILGFTLLYYSPHLSPARSHMLHVSKIALSGIAIGIILVLFLSSEFRGLTRPRKT